MRGDARAVRRLVNTFLWKPAVIRSSGGLPAPVAYQRLGGLTGGWHVEIDRHGLTHAQAAERTGTSRSRMTNW